MFSKFLHNPITSFFSYSLVLWGRLPGPYSLQSHNQYDVSTNVLFWFTSNLIVLAEIQSSGIFPALTQTLTKYWIPQILCIGSSTATSLLRHRYVTVTSLLRHCYSTVTPLLLHCYITVTPLLLHCNG